jgi:hypothetical protein
MLIDRVRESEMPLNETAAFVLRRAGQPLDEVAMSLATRFGISAQSAFVDVTSFARAANTALAVSVEPGEGRWRRAGNWLHTAICLLPSGFLPPLLSRRRALETRDPIRALAGVLRAVGVRAAALGVVAASLCLELVLASGNLGIVLPFAVGLGVALGVVLHEWGHVLALGDRPVALVVTGRRTFVLHGPLPSARASAVAVAGPAIAAAVGVVVLGLADATGLLPLAPFGGALSAHAVGLTTASADGRAACGLTTLP